MTGENQNIIHKIKQSRVSDFMNAERPEDLPPIAGAEFNENDLSDKGREIIGRIGSASSKEELFNILKEDILKNPTYYEKTVESEAGAKKINGDFVKQAVSMKDETDFLVRTMEERTKQIESTKPDASATNTGKDETKPPVTEKEAESKKFIQQQANSMKGAYKQLGREGLLKMLANTGFIIIDKEGNLTPGKKEKAAEVLHAYETLVGKADTGKDVIKREQKEKRTKKKNPEMPKQKKMAITDPRFTELINKNPNQARKIIGEILDTW